MTAELEANKNGMSSQEDFDEELLAGRDEGESF
jgi:hypothetical protein